MKIGYARVSMTEATLQEQLQSLHEAGCQDVVVDKVGEHVFDRFAWSRVQEKIKPGDIIVIWRLDRLARSIKHLVECVNSLYEKQTYLVSLEEGIDTQRQEINFKELCNHLAIMEKRLIKERHDNVYAVEQAEHAEQSNKKAEFEWKENFDSFVGFSML